MTLGVVGVVEAAEAKVEVEGFLWHLMAAGHSWRKSPPRATDKSPLLISNGFNKFQVVREKCINDTFETTNDQCAIIIQVLSRPRRRNVELIARGWRFGAQLQNIKFLSVLPATRDQPSHFPATINYAPRPAMMSIFNTSKTNIHPSITSLHPT